MFAATVGNDMEVLEEFENGIIVRPTASVLGVHHLLAKVPVYPRSSQHYPPELRRGHGDRD